MASMVPREATYRLLFVHGGSATVYHANRILLVPDRFGLLISTTAQHTEQLIQGTVVQGVSLCTISIPQPIADAVIVNPSPLGLALIAHTVGLPETSTERQHAEAVIVDLLTPAASAYELTLPTDSRLLRATQDVLHNPVEHYPKARSAEVAGLSTTTFTRRFEAQTGAFWADWCHAVKMFQAMRLLNQGLSVGNVSHLVNYRTPSTFTVAFTRYFGVTPGAVKLHTACEWCGHMKFRRPHSSSKRTPGRPK